MRSAEHFDNIINRREDGESWADSESGNVDEASVAGGGLDRIHDLLSASQTDFSEHGPDYTPAEQNYIEDFHSQDLPRGLA